MPLDKPVPNSCSTLIPCSTLTNPKAECIHFNQMKSYNSSLQSVHSLMWNSFGLGLFSGLKFYILGKRAREIHQWNCVLIAAGAQCLHVGHFNSLIFFLFCFIFSKFFSIFVYLILVLHHKNKRICMF